MYLVLDNPVALPSKTRMYVDFIFSLLDHFNGKHKKNPGWESICFYFWGVKSFFLEEFSWGWNRFWSGKMFIVQVGFILNKICIVRESVSVLREVSTLFEQMVGWMLIFNEECHTVVFCVSFPSFCLCSSGTCNQCIRTLTRLAELISCLHCVCLGVCLIPYEWTAEIFDTLKILMSVLYLYHGREKKHTATIKTSNSVRLLRLCVECLCSTSCSKESIMLMA